MPEVSAQIHALMTSTDAASRRAALAGANAATDLQGTKADGAVRFDTAQSLTDTQRRQSASNAGAMLAIRDAVTINAPTTIGEAHYGKLLLVSGHRSITLPSTPPASARFVIFVESDGRAICSGSGMLDSFGTAATSRTFFPTDGYVEFVNYGGLWRFSRLMPSGAEIAAQAAKAAAAMRTAINVNFIKELRVETFGSTISATVECVHGAHPLVVASNFTQVATSAEVDADSSFAGDLGTTDESVGTAIMPVAKILGVPVGAPVVNAMNEFSSIALFSATAGTLVWVDITRTGLSSGISITDNTLCSSLIVNAAGLELTEIILTGNTTMVLNVKNTTVSSMLDLRNCGLTTGALNQIFTDLAPSSGTIFVHGNAAATNSIASNKGYAVNTTSPL